MNGIKRKKRRKEGGEKKRKEGRKEGGEREGRKGEKEVNKTKDCLRDQKWNIKLFQIPLIMISLAQPHAV